MRKIRDNKSMHTIGNFNAYFENKKVRNSATFCVRGNKMFYLFEGKEIEPSKFESLFPVEIIRAENGKGEMPDKRANWIINQKTY